MVKYFKEAFDSEYTAKVLGSKLNSNLRKTMSNKGIDLKQLKIGTYPGDVSNRSPLWRQTIDKGIENGQMLGFLFPSGYVYIAGNANNDWIDSADRHTGDGWNLSYYSQFSRSEVAKRATPIIISNIIAKPFKGKYQDPRYNQYGKYAGQYKNPHYNPDATDWRRDDKKWYNSNPGRYEIRDKSGYLVKKLADLKSELINKYKSGNIDEELFTRFRNTANNMKSLFSKLKEIDVSDLISDYSKDYDGTKRSDEDKKVYILQRVQRDALDILSSYRRTMEEANQEWRLSIYGGERGLSDTVTKLDRINRDIADANTELDKFLSM